MATAPWRVTAIGKHAKFAAARAELRAAMRPAGDLPRLAVVSDVCVERTAGGALLLYRLLGNYPPDRLRVVYTPIVSKGAPESLLPGVTYRKIDYRVPRWIRNRFNPAWPIGMAAFIKTYEGAVLEALEGFAPEAILTVPHWYLWIAAAGAADRLGIPMHLIVHDDWPSLQTFNRPGHVADAVRWGCRRILGAGYRKAKTRLVVSPGMADEYRRRFGVDAKVLYPSRGEDSPPARVRVRTEDREPPVIAFCGWIHQEGTADALRKVARILAELGGRLDLYTGIPEDQLAARGLKSPAIRRVGFFPPAEMAERIGATAHALFMPASFLTEERHDVATLFPSKLADYTAIGLPILVWGPPYSAAGRWALENPGAAIFVSEPDLGAVHSHVVRISRDPAYAAMIAQAALRVGNLQFDVATARKTFLDAIRSC